MSFIKYVNVIILNILNYLFVVIRLCLRLRLYMEFLSSVSVPDEPLCKDSATSKKPFRLSSNCIYIALCFSSLLFFVKLTPKKYLHLLVEVTIVY